MMSVSSPPMMSVMMMLLISVLIASIPGSLALAQITTTTTPPLIDVPTYSLATLNEDGSTNMNILTYATPVSVKPDRVWTLGMYKGTLSQENLAAARNNDVCCVLQLLKEEHKDLIKVLGGGSGRDVSKREECEKLGFEWTEMSSTSGDGSSPMILPGCAYYLKVRVMGDIIDAGSHEVAVCRVEEMSVSSEDDDGEASKEYLSTGRLRDLGLITELGRVAE